ncbi:MAG: HAD family hydrolase [Candidatus Eremiobacteraeota bacterium]|nr:HAD family hydrolase [Candidatus Eremiobacteraeota bacterium]
MGVGRKVRAVFLDRDGVVNRQIVRDGRPYPPASLGELEIPEPVRPALDRLKAAGFRLIVVTNQPDVARGTIPPATVEAIHEALKARLPLDDILVCPHDDADNCKCRKPKPGLVLEGAARHAVDLGGSYLIGDRWRDVEAGHNAGVRTVFLDYGYRERSPQPAATATVKTLTEAVDWIESDLRGEQRRAVRELP